MSKKEKAQKRLLSKPKDYTIDELDTLMMMSNCQKANRGKTSGSAIEYIHTKTQMALYLHSPHPRRELKEYMLVKAINFLKSVDEI